MSKELIDSIKALGLKNKDIEVELKMPQNCLASMLTGKRAIPLKWQLALTAFVNVKNGKKKDLPISKQGKEEYETKKGGDESGVNEDENKNETAPVKVSLADIMKGRDINDRTYQRKK